MCEKFDKLDKLVRIILFIPIWGWLVSGVYRILKFVDSKYENILALIIGILCICTGIVGLVVSIVDLVTTITQDKVTFLA